MTYRLTVCTGNVRGAGTDANVCICVAVAVVFAVVVIVAAVVAIIGCGNCGKFFFVG